MHLPLHHTLLRGFAAFAFFHFFTLPLWLGAQVTPQGAFSGNTICPGGQAQLTFTATLGTGPFSVRYTDGYAIRTKTGVTSGVPFNAVSNTTATKTYTLLKVTGSDAGTRSGGFTDATGTVTVNPRPDLQSLTLDPIAPACPGSDALLKLNGFAQAQGFETQTPISTTAVGANSVYAADLDGDGDLDVLSASQSGHKIEWYKNDGSGGFVAQAAISTSALGAASVYAADLDDDGDMDVLSASSADNKIAWYKNNGGGVFTAQAAISTSASFATSVYAADLDGDGDMDVLSAGGSKIAWYKNNGGGGFTAQTDISTSAPAARSVHAADLDGDGDMDVLSATAFDDKIAWYKNDGSGGFTAQTAISTTADGAYSVYSADLDGDGDMDVLSASGNDDKIAWYKNDGGGTFVTQTPISVSADDAQSVYAADLDGDGDLDVLSASVNDDKIAWYKNDGSGAFTAQTPAISISADGAVSVYAADLDGDGDVDVLSASYSDNKIAWYKNRTPFSGNATVTYTAGGGEPQSATAPVSAGMATFALPAPKAGTLTVLKVSTADGCATGSGKTTQLRHLPRPDLQDLALAPIAPVCPGSDAMLKLNGFAQAQGFETQAPISTTADGAYSVYAADLDGDGDLDVLSASVSDDKIAWYKNDGSGIFTAQTAISTPAGGARSVYAADLDGDGDLDVLSASDDDNKIAWYKNNGSGAFVVQTAISTSANGASSVYAADLDGDGDMDVLSASANDNKIAWYKNDGSGVFTTQMIISTSAGAARSVYAADLDGDGDLDVLSASISDDKIAWYKNNGSGAFVEQTAINTTADFAQSVHAADLDGDGDVDVLSASLFDDKIAWYKNDGGGDFTAQTPISAPAGGARWVYAADLDGDGDMDVLSASQNASKIAWYKNDGSGAFVEQPAISVSADGAWSVYAADLDGDGDLDVLSASISDDKIAWYKNRTPFSGSATVTYNINGGAPQTASGAVSMGMASLTIPAPSAGTLTVTKVTNADGCETATDKATPVPPIFSVCPTDQSVYVEPTTCAALVNYSVEASGTPAPTLTYAFTGATTNSDNNSGTGSGSSFNVGVTDVVVTATSTCTPAATCSFTVTVVDNEPPTISCPSFTFNAYTDPGACSYTARADDFLPDSYSDNCSVAGIKNNRNGTSTLGGVVFYPSFQGIYESITWTVTDGNSGLTAECQVTLSVNDNEPPTIKCPTGPIERYTDPGSCGYTGKNNEFDLVSFGDNCGVGSIYNSYNYSSTLNDAVFSPGEHFIAWFVTRPSDGSGQAACSFTVQVVDNEPPTISCPNSAFEVFTDPGACSYTAGADDFLPDSYSDNCSVAGLSNNLNSSPTLEGVVFAAESYTVITWTVTDGNNSGLTANCQVTVIVFDGEEPTIECPTGSFVRDADPGKCTYTVQGGEFNPVSYDDNCPNASIENDFNYHQTLAGAKLEAGEHNITWTVWDQLEVNSAYCNITVTVVDNQPPTLTCPLNTTVNTNGSANCAVLTPDLLADINDEADNCGTASLSQLPAADAPKTNIADGGSFTVTITANDGNGNSNAVPCVVTVTVNDDDPPTFTCPSNITVNTNGSANCAVLTPDLLTGIINEADNCGTANLSQLPTVDAPKTGISDGGTFTVTVTANDGNGNTNAVPCVVTVTVNDDDKPTISGCPGNKTLKTSEDGGADCEVTLTYTAPTFSDNCDGTGTATWVSGPTSGTSLSVSSTPYTVVYTKTDAAGNAVLTDCSFTVTVQDDTKPTISGCPGNKILKTSEDGGADCEVTLTYTAPTFSDNCDGTGTATWVSGPTSGTSLSVSSTPYTVVYTKTDAAGNAVLTNCSFTVTVQDDTKPGISCPANQTVPTAPDNCSTPPVAYSVTTTDNCSSTVSLVSGPSSGSVFPLGVNTVVWKATDPGGNSTTCAFTVTVGDGQNPSIVCPASTSRNTDPNLCTAITTYATPTVSDNCTGWALTRTGGLASGSAFPKGVNMVQWQVSDVGGNVAVCQFTVTVTDNRAPVITCPANLVRSNDAGQCYAVVNYATPTATDNCGSVTVARTSAANTASGSQFPKGVTTVTWEATDNASPANTAACSFTVTVNDTQLPTITCPANQTKPADAGQCYAVVNYATPTAADNCSGVSASLANTSLPSGSQFPKGINTVQWKATDAAGLTKTCTFRITVNDTQAPTISCPASQSLNTDANLCSAVATYTTPTASDNCTTPPTVVKTSGLASGSAFPKGTSTVVWKATDGATLTNTCSFTVTVNDTQLPTITCPANISVTGSGSPCLATVSYTSPTATDNCTVQSVFLLSGPGSGSQLPAGTTTVVWRAIDNSGGSSTCAFTVTVSCGTNASNAELGVRSAESRAAHSALAIPHSTLHLAPNPATTEVQVFAQNLGETGGELTVTDAQGRTVWQRRFGPEALTSGALTLNVSVEKFAAGLYFVTLRSDGQVATKRLAVKQL